MLGIRAREIVSKRETHVQCVRVDSPAWVTYGGELLYLDLARSFSAICMHYRYRVIHCALTIMGAFRSRSKGNSRLLGGLSYEKSGCTITLLHA